MRTAGPVSDMADTRGERTQGPRSSRGTCQTKPRSPLQRRSACPPLTT